MLAATIDFEYFRGWLVEGLGYGDGSKGGRPPFDPVSMVKVLIVQPQHNLSDAKMEFMIRDRLCQCRLSKPCFRANRDLAMAEVVAFLILWLIGSFVVGYAASTIGKDILPWFVYGYLLSLSRWSTFS